MFYFDPMYWLFIGPGLILALIATVVTKSTFAKYAKVRASSGMTGAQAARHMLDINGLHDVRVEQVGGFLSDHYDPRARVLRLSPQVYRTPSLSAVGVACHEAGHALQHARHYAPLALRTALVPATQIGSNLAYVLFFIGLFMNMAGLVKLGVALFALAVLFAIVTLPVEWDASARAKRALVEAHIVTPQEQAGAAAVLNAAFLTYVASAVTALLTLLYYMMRAGLLGGNDD